ncbi:HTH-type transcriptional activator RhaS [Paenibacillus solanacearum]|uniref:HTH-type transcriptional activator RhaS n=1 Tax=Paenibacillus solanacearum TaxID=2048548 RepID=A0A916K3K0_9BACL|nr:helix-turn-helix domain-containing protein [Paenibacillus solanacearum]CAG7624087.1 HTH-type transcriptional activator RhaS [Paenibacillus solanacearum]
MIQDNRLNDMPHVLFTVHAAVSKLCRPGSRFRSRALHRYCLIYVKEGEGELRVDGETIRLSAGCAALLAPGNRVEARVAAEHPPELYMVAFSYRICRPAEQELTAADLEAQAPLFAPLAGDRVQQVPLSTDLLEQLAGTAGEPDALQSWRRHLAFQQLMYQIVSSRRAEAADGDMRQTIRSAAAYLDEHYRNDVSLKSLAQAHGISPSNFSHIFKKHTGVKPMDYLLQLRMNHAKACLSANSSVEEAAQQAGFRDAFYFSRSFKKHVGVSPAYYRRQYGSDKIMTLFPHLNDYLLALELQPFATLSYTGHDQVNGFLPYIAEQLKDTVTMDGNWQHPDVESVAEACPKLVLGSDWNRMDARRFNRVAPTITLTFREDWKHILHELSVICGRTPQYARWIRRFEQKAANARKRLAARTQPGQTVMVLIVTADELRVYGGKRQFGQLLYKELGLLPPGGIKLEEHYRRVTPDEVNAMNPDHIFVTTSNSTMKRTRLSELQASGSWAALAAVRSGRVYEVPSWLNGHAPIQHSLSIDIALRHLLQTDIPFRAAEDK